MVQVFGNLSLCLVGASIIVAADRCRAQDFVSFRGPQGTGVADNQNIPLAWSEQENLAWKAELPGGGWSQPIVLGDRVFVTTASSTAKSLLPKNFADGVKTPQSLGMGFLSRPPDVTVDWQVVCLNIASGEQLWTRTLQTSKPQFAIHPSNTYATESPVVNEHAVVTYFGAIGLVAALDLEGELLWQRDVGVFKTSNSFGTGSSLAMVDGRVYVQLHNEEKAEVLCLDALSGQTVWQAARDKVSTAWSSPLIWKNTKRTEVIISGNEQVDSFDPATGNLLWTVGNVKAATACSPCADSLQLYFGGSDPFSKGPLFAVAVGAEGDLSPKKQNAKFEYCVWQNDRAGPAMASPVSTGKWLYVVDRNIIRCYDTRSGELIYQNRLPKLEMVAASPIQVGDKLLIVDENGSACLVSIGREFQVLGGGSLPDTVWATPAVANQAIFIRGLNTLYCLRQ